MVIYIFHIPNAAAAAVPPNFYLLLSISCISLLYLVQRSERSIRSTKRRQEERTIQRVWSRWNRQRTHSPSTGIISNILHIHISIYPFISLYLISLISYLSLFRYLSIPAKDVPRRYVCKFVWGELLSGD